MHRNNAAAAVALLCGIALATAAQPAHASGFRLLYSFMGGARDGASPMADLTAAGHMLYGTTTAGGSAGLGTVFSLDPTTGAETVVHAFVGGSDGASPAAGLLKVGRTLYGTTTGGGSAGQGTVFALDLTTGAEKIVHAFQGGTADGAYPQADLIAVDGTLYGTTMMGGSTSCSFFGCGAVFSITPATGAAKILYFFQNGGDGANPDGGLVQAGRLLYGTTASGGAGDAGTVFTLNPANGAEKVVHNFDHQTDGTNPISGLLKLRGTLYAATVAGGSDDLGTVYAVNRTTNAENVLHSFLGSDGAVPEAGLTAVGGILYGTASRGGSPDDGLVFTLNPANGAERVLHVFSGQDGANPWAALIKVGGNLYGTASGGGSAGAGTVFAITP